MAGPDPLVELLDEGRASEEAAARARARAFGRQAEEGAHLAGTLVDLAERRAVVAVRTESGRTHAGVVLAVGADHVRLRADSGAEPLVALSAIVTVRLRPGEARPATGERAPADDQRLLEALARAVEERPRVTLAVRGGEVLAGRLRSVGTDVVSVELDGDPGAGCYVAGAAITEVWLDP